MCMNVSASMHVHRSEVSVGFLGTGVMYVSGCEPKSAENPAWILCKRTSALYYCGLNSPASFYPFIMVSSSQVIMWHYVLLEIKNIF